MGDCVFADGVAVAAGGVAVVACAGDVNNVNNATEIKTPMKTAVSVFMRWHAFQRAGVGRAGGWVVRLAPFLGLNPRVGIGGVVMR